MNYETKVVGLDELRELKESKVSHAKTIPIDDSWMTTNQKKFYDVLKDCKNKNITSMELSSMVGNINTYSWFFRTICQGESNRYLELVYNMGFKGICCRMEGEKLFHLLLDENNWERDIDEILGELDGGFKKDKKYGSVWSNVVVQYPDSPGLQLALKDIGYPYYWMTYTQLKVYHYIKSNNIRKICMNADDLAKPLGYKVGMLRQHIRGNEKMMDFLKERFGVTFPLRKSKLPYHCDVEYIEKPLGRRNYMDSNSVWDLRCLIKTVDEHVNPGACIIDFTYIKGTNMRRIVKEWVEKLMSNISVETMKDRFTKLHPYLNTMYELYGDIPLSELDRSKSLIIIAHMPQNSEADHYMKLQKTKAFFRESILLELSDKVSVDIDLLISKYELPAKSDAFPDIPRVIPSETVHQLDEYLLNNIIPKFKKGDPPEFGNEAMWELMIIQRWTGRRFSDAIRLITDDDVRECLRYDSKNEPVLFMHHDFNKTGIDLTIPLVAKDSDGDNIVECAIKRQKERVADLPPIKHKLHGPISYIFRMRPPTKIVKRETKLYDSITVPTRGAYTKFLCKVCTTLNLTTADGQSYIITSHQFRHTMASELVNAGVDIYVVKEFLGHTSVAMTEKYVELMKETMRKEIIEKLGESASECLIQEYEIKNTTNPYSIEWIKGKLAVVELGDGCCEHQFMSICNHAAKCKLCTKRKIYPRHEPNILLEVDNAKTLLSAFEQAGPGFSEKASEQANILKVYTTALSIIRKGEVFTMRDYIANKYDISGV